MPLCTDWHEHWRQHLSVILTNYLTMSGSFEHCVLFASLPAFTVNLIMKGTSISSQVAANAAASFGKCMGCKVEAALNCASVSSCTRVSTSMLALVLTEQREQVSAGI